MYRDDDLGLDSQWRLEAPEKNNWQSLIVSLHLEMELYDISHTHGGAVTVWVLFR